MKKLNLGSGEYPKLGFINVDLFSMNEPEVRHDLNLFPYPFPNDEFGLIEANHVVEHLHEPFQVMAELYRIAQNGAEITIRVPHFSRGFTHADHKRGFDVTFPYYFDPKFRGGFQGTPLVHKKTSLHWFSQPYLKKEFMARPLYYFGLVLGTILDFFANLSPIIASRIWCFWVGGFEEIEFRFQVIKDVDV